jgi:hypothetical protein
VSTTIGYVVDAVDASYSLEVYTGAGGVALLIHGPAGRPPASKFWLSDDGAQKLVYLLQELNMASETNADRRGRQRDALKGSLSGLSADATKHLAEEVREAAHTDPQTHRRVIEIFERLGVEWPQGFKP